MSATGDQGTEVVAIVGGGSIGVAFALVFAQAGFAVRVQDPDPGRRQAIKPEAIVRFADLKRHGLVGAGEDGVLERITVVAELADAVATARHVQECAPERLEVKRTLFSDLDRLAPDTATLASSSSALTASSFASDLPGRHRCLVAHPANPPTLIRIIEIVPAPFTSGTSADRVAALFTEAGMVPIRLEREIEGFVYNRLQGAMLREAYCLVRDGLASVDEIDRVVRDGLGLRWSVIGPFETADLNTRGGIASHAEKMGPAYARMGAERGQDDPWTPDLVRRVEAQRRALLPLDQWEDRVAWRDRALMRLIAARSGARDG